MRGAEGRVRGEAGQTGLSAERPSRCIMAVQNGSMEVGSGPRGALFFLEPGAPEGSLGPKVGPASLYFSRGCKPGPAQPPAHCPDLRRPGQLALTGPQALWPAQPGA